MGMYLSLMGTFNIFAPILIIGSTLGNESSSSIWVPFHTMYLEGPWTRPSLITLDEYPRPTKMDMSFFVVNIAYQATLDPVVDPSPSSLWMEEEDTFALLA